MGADLISSEQTWPGEKLGETAQSDRTDRGVCNGFSGKGFSSADGSCVTGGLRQVKGHQMCLDSVHYQRQPSPAF